MCFRPAGAGRAAQCPECGTFNRPDAQKCQKCGLEIVLPDEGEAPAVTAPGAMPVAPGAPKPVAPGAPKAPKTPGTIPAAHTAPNPPTSSGQ